MAEPASTIALAYRFLQYHTAAKAPKKIAIAIGTEGTR